MSPYLLMLCAFLLATCGVLYQMWDRADERADKAELALTQVKENERVVTEYVEKVVKVPGPERIRTQLVSVCDDASVPGAGRADAAAGADADNRPNLEGLAADLAAAERNKLKLIALQTTLKDQVQ